MVDGHPVLNEQGLLVLIDTSNNKEHPIDAADFAESAANSHGEAKKYRLLAETAETEKLALETKFRGIDPAEAREALALVAKVGPDGQLAIEEARKAVDLAWTQKHTAEVEQLQGKISKLQLAELTNKFLSCNVFDKTIYPKEDLIKVFGANCKEDGTYLDLQGNPLYSLKSPGQPATFEEAAENWIGNNKNKDQILKADFLGGTGGQAVSKGKKDDGSTPKTMLELITEAHRK